MQDIFALIVPEFYPDLLNTYYGEIVYFNNFKDSIQWISSHLKENIHAKFSIENNWLLKRADDIIELSGAGVTTLQLIHHSSNIYYSLNCGITQEGRRLLDIIKSLGLYLDLSHLNDEQISEILAFYKGKIIISHGACSDLLDNNKKSSNCISLETIKRVCDRDQALIGIPFVNYIVSNEDEDDDTVIINDVCNQLSYLSHAVGDNYIALGSDYFDTNYYSRVYDMNINIPILIQKKEGIQKVANILIERGLSVKSVNNILVNNVQKVFFEERL